MAWHPLGWRPAFFSEIDAFPRALLAERWPGVPIHGDFTTINEGDYDPISLLVGGTPCQAFSVAGLREGFADERGNLTSSLFGLLRRFAPAGWFGKMSPASCRLTEDGRLAAFLGVLAECGYGFAYRILDAQHFGVPQRRRRVFVVGYLGDWRPAAAVLFERESLRGDIAPRRAAGERVARPIAGCTEGGSGWRGDADTADNLIGFGHQEGRSFRYDERTTHGLTANQGIAVARAITRRNGGSGGAERDGKDNLVVADTQRSHPRPGSNSLGALAFGGNRQSGALDVATAVNAHSGSYGEVLGDGSCYTLNATERHGVQRGMSVRRLTPRECERLQGFEDDYTLITYRGRPATDGNRYRALGNSMAVPCMVWIGERIALIEGLLL